MKTSYCYFIKISNNKPSFNNLPRFIQKNISDDTMYFSDILRLNGYN